MFSKKLCASLFALGVLSSFASADGVVRAVTSGFFTYGVSETAAISKFDPSIGTLTGVGIYIYQRSNGNVTYQFENTSTRWGRPTITTSWNAHAAIPAGAATTTFKKVLSPGWLTQNDGTADFLGTSSFTSSFAVKSGMPGGLEAVQPIPNIQPQDLQQYIATQPGEAIELPIDLWASAQISWRPWAGAPPLYTYNESISGSAFVVVSVLYFYTN